MNEHTAGTSDDLVHANQGFVARIAYSYKNFGVPFEDLLNEGNVGLLEAAQRYEPARGTRFTTYAVWWIKRAILRALSRQTAMVHVPDYQTRQASAVRKAGHRLSRELGREAGREEISRALQLTVWKVDRMLQMKPKELRLDAKVGGDRDATLLDRLVDERSTNPEGEMLRREKQRLLRLALQDLSDLQLTIIVGRFGLTGQPVNTLKEMGDKLGVSRERVRQIEEQAKKRLRKALDRRHLPAADGPRSCC
jgi:RNA polymerase primary sigma factor